MASGSNAPFSGDHNDLENVQEEQHQIKGMSKTERQAFNDLVVQQAQNDFEDNLSALSYDGGFFIIWKDEDKITVTDPIIDDVEDGSTDLNWESETEVSIDSNSKVNGTYSVLFATSSTAEYGRSLNKAVNNDGTTIEVSMRVDQQGAAGDRNEWYLEGDGGNYILDIGFDHDAGEIVDFFSGTTLLSGFSTGKVYNIDIKVDFSNNEAEITVNGGSTITVSFNSNTDNISGYLLRRFNDSGTSIDFFFDDYTVKGGTQGTTNVNITTGSGGDVKLASGATSGSVNSIKFDLSSDLSEAPNNVVLSQIFENQDSNNDTQYVLTDANGNTKTITQSDVDKEVDVSNFTSEKIDCKIELSRNSTSDPNPTIEDFSAHFKV
jgi:hypothetical protein